MLNWWCITWPVGFKRLRERPLLLTCITCNNNLITLTQRTRMTRAPSEVPFVCFWRDSLHWVMASSFTRFLDHTQRSTTVGRTPLDEWSVRLRDLYLTTHNTHNRHPCPRWDSHPQFQQASGLGPRGHWYRPRKIPRHYNFTPMQSKPRLCLYVLAQEDKISVQQQGPFLCVLAEHSAVPATLLANGMWPAGLY